MSVRDLRPWPDDWCEPQRPNVTESGGPGPVSEIRLEFTDSLSREWFAYWLRSKRGWVAFTAWVDEKRLKERAAGLCGGIR
jgi:hypothetical protein